MGRGSLGPPRCLCFQELLSLGLWKGRGEGIGPLELQVECVWGGCRGGKGFSCPPELHPGTMWSCHLSLACGCSG